METSAIANQPLPPRTAPLVFTRDVKGNAGVKCFYDNDTFAELLYEEVDSYVLNPWNWRKSGVTAQFFIDILPCIAISTLILCAVIIMTFIRGKMLNSVNVILVGIAVSDALTVTIPSFAVLYMNFDEMPDYIPFEYCRLWGYLIKYVPTITHNASIWLTIVLAVERYLIVRHPMLARKYCTRRKSISR